ncbi:unnamed protein product [Prorocentrum cordatum]|uniref:Heterokaryon incompatibility domain-containing protein n=1 Tax=Prorocentrum cordatum TaxID=2364126 RepID=A0ABN9UUN2_9DINO|nr:unnamed protein product [Polarella glacialis]
MGTWPLSCWFKLPQLVATWKSLATPPSASIEMGCCMASYRSQAAEPQLPPHMPELEEVPVTADVQARWESCGGLELDPVLGSGAVVLMDAEWMVRRARTGGVLEPRQALPPTAFISHSAVKAASNDQIDIDLLHIAFISHCWLQANHPDPRGHNLRIVGQALQLLLGYFRGRWGVFMDFCCIHQNCRDREGVPQQHTYQRLEGSDSFEDDALGRFELEHALFKEALGSLGSFYSHPATVVFMLTRFPDDYGDAAKYTRSGNTEQYFNRGWCFCESSWGMLTKPSFLLLDLGRCTGAETHYGELLETCRAGRRAPLLPDAFDEELQSKGFTNGKDDRPRVAELYRSAFAQRFEAAEELLYGGLQWGDEEAQQLAAVLASGALPQLQELDLGDNRVGDEGAARLAEALRAPGALPQLQELYLGNNPLGVGGRAALRAAWAEAGRPHDGLWLGY